ncbi:Internal alternative NAD(P)H-ubiquinone oxidoreductase A1, mitochondrial, partial [Cymbomonas tetramitiformis]
DCSANVDAPLPALAQVAEQQGAYLAQCLNANAGKPSSDPPAFQYRHMGSMVSLGTGSAVIEIFGKGLTGWTAWFGWRTLPLTDPVTSVENETKQNQG